MSTRNVWVQGQVAYAEVRVFKPLDKYHLNQTLQSVHKRNENEKKHHYNEKIINVEHDSFTPLVFSCFGGTSRECGTFMSQLAQLLAAKRNQQKTLISGWLKTRLHFALLRSCLLCIRECGNVAQQKLEKYLK